MTQYKCTLCGWVYDSEKGDDVHGIPAGTEFEDLPDDWACPLCGATKDLFEKIGE
ncbi:MAG: rubredoxin [Methanosphaera sp.]|nr:rubredoxin [Methanosphaera sp.]